MSNHPGPRWLSEGIVLAAIPILAYLLTYLYEISYGAFFDIPWKLVSVNPATLVVVLVVFLPGVVLLVLYIASGAIPLLLALGALQGTKILRFVLRRWPDSAVTISRLLYRLKVRVRLRRFVREVFLPMILILVCLLITYSFRPAVLVPVGLGFIELVVFVGYQFLRDVFGERQTSLSGSRTIGRRLRVSVLELVNYFAFLLILAWGAGHFFARDTVKFLVPLSSPNTVVLDIYGDKLIVAPFNRATKAVQPEFKILTPESAGELWLEKVGRLHFEKSPSKPRPSVRQFGAKN